MSSLRTTLLCSAGTAVVAYVVASSYLNGLFRRMRIPSSITLTGTEISVSTERSGGNTLVTLDWGRVFGKLPFKIPFCSATLCDDGTIYVSGTIGLAPVTADGQVPSIVAGGPGPECFRTMEIVEAALKACGASLENITMAHVYLVDNNKERFAEMNDAYLRFWGGRPLPARITVGCSALALGSCVEIDVIARL